MYLNLKEVKLNRIKLTTLTENTIKNKIEEIELTDKKELIKLEEFFKKSYSKEDFSHKES